MKKDIQNRADIVVLVDAFYNKVKDDKTIGYVFTDVAHVNWNKHLPVMYDFWENILFYAGNYSGNPMNLHVHLSKVLPLQKKHFLRWNKLFNATVDELFEGQRADLAKQRGQSISNELQKIIL